MTPCLVRCCKSQRIASGGKISQRRIEGGAAGCVCISFSAERMWPLMRNRPRFVCVDACQHKGQSECRKAQVLPKESMQGPPHSRLRTIAGRSAARGLAGKRSARNCRAKRGFAGCAGGSGLLKAVAIHLVVEGADTDFQELGGPLTVLIGLGQRRQDGRLFR